jgi:hypothetical protein
VRCNNKGIVVAVKENRKSSFSEEKEAKRLYSLGRAHGTSLVALAGYPSVR